MGNFPSRRQPQEYSISPGEDAVQALISSPSVSLLEDNTIFLHESFFSLESSENVEYNTEPEPCVNRFVTGTEETPECLNSSNFHTSFFASLVWDRRNLHQSGTQTLLNAVDSHRWSIQCPEYVALCASFILSILQTYGQCIPGERKLISQKTIMMFNALDDLHESLSKMKRKGWHVDEKIIRWNSCSNCDIRQMILMQVNFQNGSKSKFCPVCLHLASFCHPETHNKLKSWLLADIFPYICSSCEMRFSTEVDFLSHLGKNCASMADGELGTVPANVFCCFLCRLPFKTRGDLTMHNQSSLEHSLRKEVALEIAERNAAASNKPSNLQVDSDFSLTNNKLQEHTVYEENLFGTTTSSPDVSDAQYYCSPCATFVQKCNVVDHERGLKHQLKCEGWMKCLRRKPQKTKCQKDEISSENRSPRSSESRVSVKDASTSINKSEYESVDQKVKKHLEEFFILENDQVEICDGHYLCKCSFKGTMYEMLNHRLKNPNICCNVKKQALEVLENKLRIVTALMSLFVQKQMYNSLKLINMDAVQSLIDKICLYNDKTKSDLYCPSEDLPALAEDLPSLEDLPPLAEDLSPLEEDQPPILENLDPLAEDLPPLVEGIPPLVEDLPQLAQDLPPLVEDLPPPAQELPPHVEDFSPLGQDLSPLADLTASMFTATEDDIRKAIVRYLFLDEMLNTSIDYFRCTRCNVRCQTHIMLSHAISKSHIKLKYIRSHSISVLEEKLRILEWLDVIKTLNGPLMANINAGQLKSTISVTHKLIKLRKSGTSVIRLNQLKSPSSGGANFVETNSTSQKDGAQFKSQPTLSSENSAASCTTEMSSLGHSQNDVGTSESRIIIGESASVSLQEEVTNACAGQDLSDYDMECEACGGVFLIFNGDVEVSLDMHIQTDPQHALATAVPVDRNVQNVAEVAAGAKSKTEPVKQTVQSVANNAEEAKFSTEPAEQNALSLAEAAAGAKSTTEPLKQNIQSVVARAKSTTEPVGQNAPSVAEVATGAKPKKKPIRLPFPECKNKVVDLISLNAQKVSEYEDYKQKCMSGLLEVEQKFVGVEKTQRKNKYTCELCRVVGYTESQIFHHLLTPGHLHESMREHTREELDQKLLQLNRLLQYKFGSTALNSAISILTKYQGVPRPSKPKSLGKASSSQEESQEFFYCSICMTSMSYKSHIQHLRGKKHQRNTSAVLSSLQINS